MTQVKAGEILASNYRAAGGGMSRYLSVVDVLQRDGQLVQYSAGEVTSFTTDRTAIDIQGETVRMDGEIVGGWAGGEFQSIPRGFFYADFGIRRTRGGQIGSSPGIRSIGKGYIYDGHELDAGQFVEAGPSGGQGRMVSIALANPAAGVEYTPQTVPVGALWKLRGFVGQLVTAVAAQNRIVTIEIGNGTQGISGGVASEIQTANIAETYLGANPGLPSGVSAGLGTGVIAIGLPDFPLPAGFTINPTTFNLQAADDWAAGILEVEEWLVP